MGLLEPHGRGRRHVRRDALNEQPPPVVVVYSLAHAVAALEAARERAVVLLSAPGAGIYAGAGWWTAVVDAARNAMPAAPFSAILDCGADAGAAMAALRAGAAIVVFTGRSDVAERLAGIAAQRDARLLTARPQHALDLAECFFADGDALRRHCAEFFADDG